MIIVGGLAMLFHFLCSLKCGKRSDPGKLILFAASAVAAVAGVYVFSDALTFALHPPKDKTFPMQNEVWAAIGGGSISLFTLNLLIDEIRMLFVKPVDPIPPSQADQRPK